MDRLHETAVAGSLRWWYEAVVRGLGGRVEQKCDFNADIYFRRKREGLTEREALAAAGLCDVCRVFGAAGWRRRFKVVLDDDRTEPRPGPRRMPSLRRPDGGWYVMPGRLGFIVMEPGLDGDMVLLLATVKLMENWTGIGARTAAGYGVFSTSPDQLQVTLNEETAPEGLGARAAGPSILPSLTDFFFAKISFRPAKGDWWTQFREVQAAIGDPSAGRDWQPFSPRDAEAWVKNGWFPISPIIRNWMRFELFRALGEGPAAFIFGTARRVCDRCYRPYANRKDSCPACHGRGALERVRTKIGISHAYLRDDGAWEFRVWGYIPAQAALNQDLKLTNPDNVPFVREAVLEPLYEALRPGGTVWQHGGIMDGPCRGAGSGAVGFAWREFDSPRDTECRMNRAWPFMASLARRTVP